MSRREQKQRYLAIVLHATGLSYREIAEQLGRSKMWAWYAVNGR